ncbi:hypothetical protein J7M23_00330 [Candidatus Sumerlaeota bacterium]|nr:hypothetical protein [Candidatus Sumerlaeota bacterium]
MFRRHAIGLLVVLALITGIIHIIPYGIVALLASPSKGTPHLIFLLSADEEHYLVQLNTAYNGRYRPGNRYLLEHALPPDVQKKFLFNGINLLGLIGRLSGLSFGTFLLIIRFLFPMIAFLLLYLIFLALLSGQKITSAIFALVGMCIPYAVYGHIHFIDRLVFEFIIKPGVGWNRLLLNSYLPWARLVNPQFTGLFFLAGLLLLIQFVLKPKGWIYLLASIPFFLLSSKFYFYHWSSLIVFIGVIFLSALWQRKRRIWLPLLLFILVGLVVVMIELPQLLQLASNKYGALYTYSLLRSPVVSPGVIASLILLFVFLAVRQRINPEEKILLVACILTPVVCINQQVLSGRAVQVWHYELFTSPIYLWCAVALLWRRIEPQYLIETKLAPILARSVWFRRILVWLIIIAGGMGTALYFLFHLSWSGHLTHGALLSFMFYASLWLIPTGGALGVVIPLSKGNRQCWFIVASAVLLLLAMGDGLERQTYTTLRRIPEFRRQQTYASALYWLKNNTPLQSVVLAPMEIAEFLPAVAHTYVYIAKNAVHYRVAQQEREERLANYFYILGLTYEEVDRLTHQYPYRYILWGLRYFSPRSYDLYSFGHHQLISKQEVERFRRLFSTRSTVSVEELFKYRLDYVLLSRDWLNTHSLPQRIKDKFTRVYEDENAVLFSHPANIKTRHHNENTKITKLK